MSILTFVFVLWLTYIFRDVAGHILLLALSLFCVFVLLCVGKMWADNNRLDREYTESTRWCVQDSTFDQWDAPSREAAEELGRKGYDVGKVVGEFCVIRPK
jgi:hypothetical protein